MKKQIKKLILTLLLSSLANISQAATYYLSSTTGNDSQDGLSESSAWQTIDKLNSEKLANGDTILFKRGDTFRGSIASKPKKVGITFSTYGDGAKPVISGSILITSWIPTTHPQLPPQVYETDLSTQITVDKKGNERKIQHLFVDGELMTIARYPNVNSPSETNWLKVGTTAGKDAFTDPALIAYVKPNNYWNGATLRIRTYSWLYNTFEVTGYDPTSGKIIAEGLGNQLPEWGYFLDDKLEELDHPGEWYYDATVKKVYFYPTAGQDPNTLAIKGTTYSTGLSVANQQHNTVVDNLHFKHFTNVGVNLNSSDNPVVQHCDFSYNKVGLTNWNTANLQVSNNQFTDQLSVGLNLKAAQDFDIQNSVVEDNTILRSGMFPLYCARYGGSVCYGVAISVGNQGHVVRRNTIEYTGWNAINLEGNGYHTIENNLIRYALARINDGGAIWIKSDGNVIRGNFLLDTIGNVDESNGCGSAPKDGKPCSKHHSYGMGIGSNPDFKENVIENNTIANNVDIGIRINGFDNTIIRNNILYNNGHQVRFEGDAAAYPNNILEFNTLYGLQDDQDLLWVKGDKEFGTMDNNFYCHPYLGASVRFGWSTRYSLPQWQQKTGDELHSTVCNFIHPPQATLELGVNLLENGTFDVDTVAWKGGSHDPAQIDGGSLKFVRGSGKGVLHQANRLLEAGQTYRVQFSIVGIGPGVIDFNVHDEWENLISRPFYFDTVRRDYTFTFQSPVTTSVGRVLFALAEHQPDTYWLDNVSLVPVQVLADLPRTERAKLFMNSSAQPLSVDFQGINYLDLAGQPIGQFVLEPYSSAVFLRSDDNPPLPTPEPVPEPAPIPEPTPIPGPTPVPEPTPLEPVILPLPEDRTICPPEDVLDFYCNAEGKTVENLSITVNPRSQNGVGFLSNAVISGTVRLEPDTWISNISVNGTGTVIGGILTGKNYNDGYLGDFEFRGEFIKGGILGGLVVNNSRIFSYYENVTLAPKAHLVGGALQGNIHGDPDNPALLENLRILSGSVVSGVIIGNGVKIAPDVTIEDSVQNSDSETALPTLGKAKASSIDGSPIAVTTSFNGGISVNESSFQSHNSTQAFIDHTSIRGQIHIDEQHIGQKADIFVTVTYYQQAESDEVFLFTVNHMHGLIPWDGVLTTIANNPFRAGETLQKIHTLMFYDGVLFATGLAEINFGYLLEDGTLVYSNEGIFLTMVE